MAIARLSSVASVPAADFYYYGDAPVFLQRDREHIAVELVPRATVQSLAAIKMANGKSAVRSLVAEIPRKRRYVVRLASEQGDGGFRQAAQLIGRDPRVRRTYPVFRNPKTGKLVYIFDEIVVRLRKGVDETELAAINARFGVETVERNRYEPDIYLLRVKSDRRSALEVANAYARSGLFAWAEPNLGGQIDKFQVNDPLFPQQWHLKNDGQNGGTPGADSKAQMAWTVTTGSAAIVIAFLDDGCDLGHEDLAANLFVNPGETGEGRENNGVDDDGNGYIDDVCGWDFYGDDNDPGHVIPTGTSEGHGTAAAGIAAAVGNNGLGVASIAYGCRILPVKIFRGDNYVGDYEVANAIRYAAVMADVISNSWGGGAPSQALESAIEFAVEQGRGGRGCPVFFAAGNSGLTQVEYPASNPWTIAVGATDRNDVRYSYSSYGSRLTLVSPSGNYTTDRTGTGVGYDNGEPDTTGNYTGLFGGTSSACPLAAGAGALLLALYPDLAPLQVQQILQSAADKVSPAQAQYDSYGFSREYGYGRLNAYQSLLLAQQADLLDDQFEENDTRDQAATVDEGFFTALSARDEDWFAIQVEPLQDFLASIYFVHSRGDLQLQLYDHEGNLVAASTGTTNRESVEVVVGPQGGLFYVRVYGEAGASNFYHLVLNKRPPDDRFEPNDRPEDAARIAPGDYDDLCCYDLDYYRVTVGSGQKIMALIRFFNDLGDLDLYLLDPSTTEVASSLTTNDSEGVWYVNQGAPGDFYVVVSNYMEAENSYRLQVRVGAGQDDAFEENDIRVSAAVVGPGTYNGLQPYDDDWYEVAVGPHQLLEAEIRFFHAVGDLDLEMYDSEGNLVDWSDGVADSERVLFANTTDQPASAYPLVYSYLGDYPDYSLRIALSDLVDDAFEENDSIESPAVLAPGGYGDLVAFDADYYGIHVPEGLGVAAMLVAENISSPLRMTLLSPDGTSLASVSSSSETPMIIKRVMAADALYRILVDREATEALGLYDLSVFVFDSSMNYIRADGFEPNNARWRAARLLPGAYPNLLSMDTDFYKVHMYEGDGLCVAIAFDSSQADLDLYLYGPWGQMLDYSDGVDDTEFCVVEKVPAGGDCYIEVFPYSGQANYDLFVGRFVRGRPSGPLTAARHWSLY